MKSCETCGKEVNENELLMSSQGEVCAECSEKEDSKSKMGGLPLTTIIGFIAGLVPFFFRVVTSSSTTINGKTSVSYFDYAALAGGALAIIMGIVSIVTVLRTRKDGLATTPLALAVLCILLGGFQLLRGFGVVMWGFGM